MTTEQIDDALHRQPFVPFTLHIADGRKIHVDHEDFVMRSRSGRAIAVYRENDRIETFDVFLITSIEEKRKR